MREGPADGGREPGGFHPSAGAQVRADRAASSPPACTSPLGGGVPAGGTSLPGGSSGAQGQRASSCQTCCWKPFSSPVT